MILSRYSRIGVLGLSAVILVQVIASLALKPGYPLTLLADVIQGVLLLAGVLAFLWAAVRTQARTRFFFSLFAMGSAFWLLYQVFWIYLEVYRRREVPDPFGGDVVLFLHIVPLIAAVALQPHREHNDSSGKVRALDFSLLMTWWLFLYIFAVIPWQYVRTNVGRYDQNFSALYTTEETVILAALVYSWWHSRGWWRLVYGQLLGASALYAVSSYAANWGIARGVYFSGSVFDLPLEASMAWMVGAGLLGVDLCPHAEPLHQDPRHRSWRTRLGMATIFTLPIFAAYAALHSEIPSQVRLFRISSTLLAMLTMGAIVFLKQHVLDRELLGLVHKSTEALGDLKRVQDQLIQSEKLASMARMVGGAAHELNNPLTAMLGYSDLLASAELPAEQRDVAQKIGQQARRTKNLVDNLINFARQSPGEKTPVQLNTLVQTALRLSKPQLKATKIEVGLNLASNLPLVSGDSNQLLQVFLQLIKNTIHAPDGKRRRVFISSAPVRDTVQVEFILVCEISKRELSSKLEAPGAGLGACYGIVGSHNGRITSETRPEGQTIIRIELPAESSPLVLAERSMGD